MEEEGIEVDDFRESRKISFYLVMVGILAVCSVIFLIWFFYGESMCGDGTPYNSCSLNLPYFCMEGKLIEKASACGCPLNMSIKDNSCVSKYQTGSKSISLKYVLNGKKGEINFTVYKGIFDYLSNLPRSIVSEGNRSVSIKDFKLRLVNDPIQEEAIIPLVVKIQNLEKKPINQLRVAVSLVQNIQYRNINKTFSFRGMNVSSYQYPYGVLYNLEGVCSGKSDLLALLLKKLDFNVALFYYKKEKHEAVGVKCPLKYSLSNTGYCFIESGGPSIISNNQSNYAGGLKLLSKPEVIEISDGIALGEDMREYDDAKDWIKLNEKLQEKGVVRGWDTIKLHSLKQKYGLEDF